MVFWTPQFMEPPMQSRSAGRSATSGASHPAGTARVACRQSRVPTLPSGPWSGTTVKGFKYPNMGCGYTCICTYIYICIYIYTYIYIDICGFDLRNPKNGFRTMFCLLGPLGKDVPWAPTMLKGIRGVGPCCVAGWHNMGIHGFRNAVGMCLGYS